MTGVLVTVAAAAATAAAGGALGYRVGHRHGLREKNETLEDAVSILKGGEP
jgi:hypothetical protein